MTDKRTDEQAHEQEEGPAGGLLLWLLLGILLVMLVGGGFAIASFLGLISFDDMANKARQLPQKIPVVAQYFSGESRLPEGTEQTGAEAVTPVPPEPVAISQPDLLKNTVKQAGQLTPEAAAKAKAEADKNISRLARLYGNMKPEEAAPIMKELDDDLVVTLLRKMEDEQAAKILSAMEPQRAARLTRLLAGKQRTVIQVN